jgi:hypothetical protein
MRQQHLNPTQKEIAPSQPQTEIAQHSTHPIEQLQSLVGNRAVNQLLANQPTVQTKPMFRGLSHELVVQPKLTIGVVGDKYEREADRVASQVVDQINAPQSIQREEISENDEELSLTIQRFAESSGGIAVTPELETTIQQSRRNGQPLPDSIRKPMEQSLQADFSEVRIHTDSTSDQLNRSIQAQAFTTGQDVFFRQGAYKPGSRGGQELIAHELTHVVQQGSGKQSANISSVQELVVQRRLPPENAIAVTIDLTGNAQEAKFSLYRLFYVEQKRDRLVKADGKTRYDDAWDAVSDVFPNDRFDAQAYQALYAANQKYESVLPDSQDISNDHWGRLAKLAVDASQLASTCSRETFWIEEVFGPKADTEYISNVYKRASERLTGLSQKNFKIDYNGDDAEMHIGGSTVPGSGQIKVSPQTLKGTDSQVKTVLLHEACHEVDATVIDCGYYGTDRFDKMSQKEKKANAAHYEEIAKRLLGQSKYKGAFIPEAIQKKPKGKRDQFINTARLASEGLRNLWEKTTAMHDLLRNIAAGVNRSPIQQQVKIVQSLKSMYSLGTAGNREGYPVLTQLELALMESTANVLARAMKAIGKFKHEKDPSEQKRLAAMEPQQLILEAIEKVGGFQGLDKKIDKSHINSIREGLILLDLEDPFKNFVS